MKLLTFGNLYSLDDETLATLNEKLQPLNIELVLHAGSGEEGYIYVNVSWQTCLKRALKAHPEIKKDDERRKKLRSALIQHQKELDARSDRLGQSCFAIGERDLEHLDGLVELFKYIIKENT